MKKEIVDAAFEEARLESELEQTELLIRTLASFGIDATLSRITDIDGKPHPAVVLTPDQYPAMIEFVQQAGINQFTL